MDSPTQVRSKLRSSVERPGSSKGIANEGTILKEINRLDLRKDITFEVRELLWDQLKEKVNIVEWDEVKSILGEDIIEQNQVCHQK